MEEVGKEAPEAEEERNETTGNEKETTQEREKEASGDDIDRKLPEWMLEKKNIDVPDEAEEQAEDEGVKSTAPNVSDSLNDEDQSTTPPTLARTNRAACKYGEQCYRSNPAHKAEFSHPGDEDYATKVNEEERNDDDQKAECQYGTACYRQNPQHKRDFKHTQPPQQTDAAEPQRKRATRPPAKRRRVGDEDYESDADKDYDLEDSFIDDDSEDEEEVVEEEEDDDYVPNKEELDPELLKDDQWKPENDDAHEVLELLKEARDYLRNKKLQK